MKKVLIVVVLIVALGVAGFLYATRDLAAPSAPGTQVADESVTENTEGAVVYHIDSDLSKVQYELDEVLKGSPKHVIGTTSDISGQITIASGVITMGDILINARTFKTDAEKRDNAVGRYILKSEEAANEFIALRNIVLSNVSGQALSGATVQADATGDLTIAGMTMATVFRVEGTLGADGVLAGIAKATVKRSEFDLKIPEVQSVANVTNEVILTISIVARAL